MLGIAFKMKKIIRLVLLFVFAIGCTASFAIKTQTIVLKDKSVLKGKIMEMKNGTYYIKIPSIGVVKINADQIVEIKSSSVRPSRRGNSRKNIQTIDSKRNRYNSKSSTRATARSSSKRVGSSNLQVQQDQVNSRVKSMMMDGNFLDSIMNLSSNQQMMDVMQDPEIMEAIGNNDYDYLMNSDKMRQLMESDGIQDLLGGM